MSAILSLLESRLNEEWMIGCNPNTFYKLTQSYIKKFQQLKSDDTSPKVILAQQNYQDFLAAFLAGIVTNCHLFLADFHWQQQEWQQIIDLIQPDLILGIDLPYQHDSNRYQNHQLSPRPLIMIPTGGTSGKIRFAIHTWPTLTASVQGFINFFHLNQVNTFCVLPIYHVSGLMQFLRSFLSQGKLIIYPYQNLKKNIIPPLNIQDFFLSLVPTQLQLLLTINPQWLTQFKTILLGGASPWETLLNQARDYQLNLSPTYGMTETASQIVTLKPQAFLQGNNSTGQVLPHAKLTINQQKIIAIQAKSLFLGYYPKLNYQQQFITDDLGYFDNENNLYIIGRNNQKIITGGENVFPKEVEKAILATNLVEDVSVIGIPDEQWGEVITALYIPKHHTVAIAQLQDGLQSHLSRYKQPKHWICVDRLPRNQQGKLNYQTLQKIALTHLNPKKHL